MYHYHPVVNKNSNNSHYCKRCQTEHLLPE
ncbi:zinc finger domain-containing protein [Clostridium segne]